MEQTHINFEGSGIHIHKDYYPTPPALARKMAKLIPDGCGTILEPSAGKGDLAGAIADRYMYHSVRAKDVDVIEIIPELQAILRDSFRVVGSDFLQFQGCKSYDAIVMNPPFSEGVKHILHAWSLIYSGTVIALVNVETLNNPHTKERQLLAKIIEDHGEVVEIIEGAFCDAERKTAVDVAIICLTRTRTVEFDYFKGMNTGQASDSTEDAPEFKELAISGSQIANKVQAFNSSVEATRAGFIHQAEAKHYRRMLLEGEERYESDVDLTAWVKKETNEALLKLQEEAWRHIVALSEFQSVMTSNTQRNFEISLTEVVVLEFTESNIRQFLLNLLAGRDKIFNDCLLEVFEGLTRYYKDNRVWVEGWKSNDYFFVGKRVVLPNLVSADFGFRWSYHGNTDKLRDLDRVMAFMQGRRETHNTIITAVENYKNNNGSPFGEKIESEHFYIRVYKKGTVHLYFKDLDALARFNLAVGRMRGWLPKEDKKVPKEFWLMNK